MKSYGLIGAGGFGREVMPIYREQVILEGDKHKIYFVVEDGYQGSSSLIGVEVITQEDFLNIPGDRFFNIAIADHSHRSRIAKYFLERGAIPYSIIDKTVRFVGKNSVGRGFVACHLSTITADAVIGDFVHLNIYSYIAHDCRIGNFVTFAPSVNCNGNVIIEDCAYIGTGVIIKQGTKSKPLRIGSHAVVGMGAVVTRDVEPNMVVVGNPARPLTLLK